MTYLLDANVLIALTVAEHEHHDRAAAWLSESGDFAVCPIVEGALVRFLLRMGEGAMTAHRILERLAAHPRCQFWGDDLSYRDVPLANVQGHRQVTDSYLATLAERHGARLATFDRALAAAHPASTQLIQGG
ncbi:TA system VapC family ribonuclease toxin [Ruania zhangjianzhongii]|uniref:TA system VapC family ribonuclease toxin n=1 Tax=Ruania zhangjianzhongii TaxID=2603206 RepID=UPI0011C9F6CD|nr:TA system VapC family ribonuclease toxin [Ruania zhangjianzhongii]